jgi:NADH dehydrogenase/NADH:ubiquinone oxidoreductase subunit G
MNTPTPLGKTYEQYKKELKEFKEINLSKVERVELALVDDLKEGDKFYKVALDMAMSVNDEIENLSSMMNAVKSAASTAEDKYKVLAKIEKQAKELGVNTNDIAGYKRSANNENYVINIQKSIGKALGSIKGAKL